MNRTSLSLGVFLLGFTLSLAIPTARSAELQPDALPAEWQELVEQLQAPTTIRSEFEERRMFGFRAEPVILRGEMRMIRGRGLSLHYTHPEDHIVIVDEQGVLVRDARGRTRAAPRQAAASTQPLLEVLNLDLAALAETFTLEGEMTDEWWHLRFEPRQPDAPDTPGAIELSGTGTEVRSILLQPRDRRQVEIHLSNTTKNATFTDDEVRRYFR